MVLFSFCFSMNCPRRLVGGFLFYIRLSAFVFTLVLVLLIENRDYDRPTENIDGKCQEQMQKQLKKIKFVLKCGRDRANLPYPYHYFLRLSVTKRQEGYLVFFLFGFASVTRFWLSLGQIFRLRFQNRISLLGSCLPILPPLVFVFR